MFSEENLRQLDRLRSKYPKSKPLVLPALWMAQRQFGWISPEAMKYVAGLLDLPVSHVYSVVTFYTMFNTKPVGKYHLQVCTNVSCMLRGSERIVEHLERRLGTRLGSTSADGKWTLSEVECMGSCGTAPMVALGEEYYENLTPDKVDRILEGLK